MGGITWEGYLRSRGQLTIMWYEISAQKEFWRFFQNSEIHIFLEVFRFFNYFLSGYIDFWSILLVIFWSFLIIFFSHFRLFLVILGSFGFFLITFWLFCLVFLVFPTLMTVSRGQAEPFWFLIRTILVRFWSFFGPLLVIFGPFLEYQNSIDLMGFPNIFGSD